jgi:hypothetical protein
VSGERVDGGESASLCCAVQPARRIEATVRVS